MRKGHPLFGLLAEFETPDQLLLATRKARGEGYTKLDAYTPYPVEGLAEALGFHETQLPLIVLLGGLLGAVGGYSLQYWLSVRDYPVNAGGRPLNSVPSFVIVTFELTILVAAFSAVLGMLALNRLPMPYHPVFNVPGFKLASRNRFFLSIEAVDPRFDREGTSRFLEGLQAKAVSDIEQ
jgi:hypothetical protein